MSIPHQVLEGFGLTNHPYTLSKHGNGLIHATYVVKDQDEPVFILQQVNHQVFKKPEDIAFNLHYIGQYLAKHHPAYPFAGPIKTVEGNDYVIVDDRYYRLIPYIKDSHTVDVCANEEQAYAAARAFGRFTSMLSGLDLAPLKPSIPGFHDLLFRYTQFEEALKKGNAARLSATANVATYLAERKHIVDQFAAIQTNPAFSLRVTHHDTKINNVLFDHQQKEICVIDLDTVMPGYFISDIGDMMRTYISPANEEEADLDKVIIRRSFIEAIIEGYSSAMGDKLSPLEKQAFIYGGKFMIYMQALRFYTDHLNNDVYYGARYENHNLIRANNQVKLLSELEAIDQDFSRSIL